MATATKTAPKPTDNGHDASENPISTLKFSVTEFATPLPVKSRGSVRQPNPFDDVAQRAAKDGQQRRIELDMSNEDAVKLAISTLRKAVAYIKMGVDIQRIDTATSVANAEGTLVEIPVGLYFKVRKPITRNRKQGENAEAAK